MRNRNTPPVGELEKKRDERQKYRKKRIVRYAGGSGSEGRREE